MTTRTIAVLGMMCAGCAGTVERTLSRMEGVTTANVNLAARTVTVTYDERLTSPQAMKERLAQAGYDLVIEQDRNVEAIERRQYQRLRRKVAVAWLLSLLCMAIGMGWIETGSANAANQLSMLIALAAMVWCGRDIYHSAWRQTLHATANMDTLVAMSTIISFGFSFFNTFWGDVWTASGMEWHTYYDATVMILTFVLTGRMLEERAKHSTASAIRSLMGLAPKTARVVSGDALVEMPLAAVQPGDCVEVRAGEKVAVDGVVTAWGDTTATIDESMISGEPQAVAKHAGDRVLAGTIVVSGALRFTAREVGSKTMLAQIIRMVQQAQGSMAPCSV